MNDWKPKKASLRSHRPPTPSIEPMPGSSMSPSALPSRSNSLSCELALCSYCARIFPSDDARALQDAVALRNNFLPVGALGIGRVHHEQMEVRRAFVGRDVNLAAENFAAVMKILAAGDFDAAACRLSGPAEKVRSCRQILDTR